MNGIYFYKLQSQYPNDVTKNCKLTINELDSNFLFLEDMDIKEVAFDRETKTLVLTRNNGETLVTTLGDMTYNLKVSYDDGSVSGTPATITLEFDGADGKECVTIDKLVTTDYLKDLLGDKLLDAVITDDTLRGNGTLASPLSVNKAYTTGTYAPVTTVIDTTNGESLPTVGAYGSRYITKEIVSDYGYLYNYEAVQKIAEHFNQEAVEGKEEYTWHIPTKAEWDKLLDSREYCDEDMHDTYDCHVELGEYAGSSLKTACGWVGEPECNCDGTYTPASGETPSYVGVDDIGMSIYPSGIANLDGEGNAVASLYGSAAYFWSSTHINDDEKQDLYVKIFSHNKSTVRQEADCPDVFYSVRLVKEYNGSNYFGSEIVDGVTYNTILVPETKQVWLATNVYYGENAIEGLTSDSYVLPNNGDITNERVVFYINEWNGVGWDRKEMLQGDSVVINDAQGDKEANLEYRVMLDEDCNQILVDTDDIVTDRVLDEIIQLLEAETEARISGDTYLQEQIDAHSEILSALTETNARQDSMIEELSSTTIALSGAIETEIARANEIEGQLIDNSVPYILKVTEGLILKSKDGLDEHSITIQFDGNYGSFE